MHLEQKYVLKSPAFCLESEILVLLNKRGGVVGTFLLIRKLIMTDQFNLTDVLDHLYFTLSLFRTLSLVSITISEQCFKYVFSCCIVLFPWFWFFFFSKLLFFYGVHNYWIYFLVFDKKHQTFSFAGLWKKLVKKACHLKSIIAFCIISTLALL